MLTTGDVAKLFNVSAQTVINWLEQGRLPFERIGNGPRRLTESNVFKYIQDIRISPEALDSTLYQAILHSVNGNKRQLEGPRVWVLGKDGQILMATDASLKATGLTDVSEAQGVPYNRILQLSDPATRVPVVLGVAQPGQVQECHWSRIEGAHSGLLTVTPWYSLPTEVGGWVLVFRAMES